MSSWAPRVKQSNESEEGLKKYDKFYADLIDWLKFNSIPVPLSITENIDGELYQGSIGGKHDYASYCITSDGQFLLRGCKSRMIKIFSLASQQMIDIVDGFQDSVISTAISEDKKMMVSVSSFNQVSLWNLGDKHVLSVMPPQESFVKLARFCIEMKYIVASVADGSVIFWSIGNPKEKIKKVKMDGGYIYCLECSPTGPQVAAGCEDGSIRLISSRDFKEEETLEAFEGAVLCLCFNKDGTMLIAGSLDKTIKILMGPEYTDVLHVFQHYGPVNALAINAESNEVISASNKLLVVFKFGPQGTHETKEVFIEEKICNIYFTAEHNTAAVCCANDKIIVTNVETGKVHYSIMGRSHGNPISAVLASPDSKYALSGTAKGDIKMWSLDTFQFMANLQDPNPETNDVTTIQISADSKYIACGPYRQFSAIKLWLQSTCQIVQVFEAPGGVDDIAFSYDSQYLITSTTLSDFWLFDLESLEKIVVPKNADVRLQCLVQTKRAQDKKLIIGVTNDQKIMVWSYPDIDLVACMQEEDPCNYHLVVVSVNGKYLATASDKHTIGLWSLRKYNLMKNLEGHTDRILSICFSPDANYIISCSRNDRVLIWSAFYGDARLFTLEGETRTINWVSITPNSKYILGGSDDASINIWRLDSNQPKSYIRTDADVDFYAITPCSKTLAIVMDNVIEFWSLERMVRIEETYDIMKHKITTVTFTPNSMYMLVGSIQEANVVIVSMKSLNVVGQLLGLSYGGTDVYSIVCSPDSKFAITADSFQVLYKWSLTDNTCQGQARVKNDKLKAAKNVVVISNNSKYVIAGYANGNIGVWEFETMSNERFMSVHENSITQLAVTIDGQFIISASLNDKVIRINSLETLEQVDTIENTHSYPVSSISLDSQTKFMVGVLEDKTCRIWSLQAFQEIEVIDDNETGSVCCLSPNAKYLIIQTDTLSKTVVLPFLSEEFQTYPFILNLIKAHCQANSASKKEEIVKSLITIITKHRKYYQLVLNPIFSIITLLLNEKQTTESILSQYLTPYKLFAKYEPLTVVVMNHRIESAQTYLDMLENYRKENGFYPYFDPNFIELLLTKYPNLINSIDMKKFIIHNLFYKFKVTEGELDDEAVEVIDLDVFNFAPRDIEDQLVILDKHINLLLKENPRNVQNYNCYVSLIPLNFANGSVFSRCFFSNIHNFGQHDIENKLSKFIYLKFNMVFYHQLVMTVIFWSYNMLLYLFLGFYPESSVMATFLYLLGIICIVFDLKYMFTEGLYNYFRKPGKVLIFLNHVMAMAATIIFHLNWQRDDVHYVHYLRVFAITTISLRGIWRMRIFKTSRFLVSMIYEVVLRIRSFFVIFFFLLILFENAWRILPSMSTGSIGDDTSLTESVTSALNIAFMSYDTSNYGLKEWIVFTIGILLLNFIMLNYLVSIICIAYEEISDSTLMTDLSELLLMINETDYLVAGMEVFEIKKFVTLINSVYYKIREKLSKTNKRMKIHYAADSKPKKKSVLHALRGRTDETYTQNGGYNTTLNNYHRNDHNNGHNSSRVLITTSDHHPTENTTAHNTELSKSGKSGKQNKERKDNNNSSDHKTTLKSRLKKIGTVAKSGVPVRIKKEEGSHYLTLIAKNDPVNSSEKKQLAVT